MCRDIGDQGKKDKVEIKEIRELFGEINSKLNTVVERIVAFETSLKFQSGLITQFDTRLTYIERHMHELEIEGVKTAYKTKDNKRLSENIESVKNRQYKNTFITGCFSKLFWVVLGAAVVYFLNKKL